MTEIYFSTDIEADGPIPGKYSMLSMGSAAYYEGNLISSFLVNLYELPDAQQHEETMKWWQQPRNRQAYNSLMTNRKNPREAITKFKEWVLALSHEHKAQPVFVSYPASYDFMFVYWYLINFTESSPFSFSAFDIKTAACILLKKPYRQATKKNFPKKWFGNTPHTHQALDDAIGQGEIFCSIIKENKVR